MGSILLFFSTHKTLVIAGILALIIGSQLVYITILRAQKDTLVAEKQVVQTQLDESQANVVRLANDIKSQNVAIQQLKADADIRVAKNAAAVKKAQETAAGYKKQAEELLKRKPPQNVPKCDAAHSLIQEEMKNARK